MALTISKVDQQDVGDGEIVVADVTFDSSYPTGGESVTASDLGFRVGSRLDSVGVGQEDGHGVEFVPDGSLPDRGKLKVYQYDYDAASDGVAVEVPDTTDLSTLTLRVTAHGR